MAGALGRGGAQQPARAVAMRSQRIGCYLRFQASSTQTRISPQFLGGSVSTNLQLTAVSSPFWLRKLLQHAGLFESGPGNCCDRWVCRTRRPETGATCGFAWRSARGRQSYCPVLSLCTGPNRLTPGVVFRILRKRREIGYRRNCITPCLSHRPVHKLKNRQRIPPTGRRPWLGKGGPRAKEAGISAPRGVPRRCRRASREGCGDSARRGSRAPRRAVGSCAGRSTIAGSARVGACPDRRPRSGPCGRHGRRERLGLSVPRSD